MDSFYGHGKLLLSGEYFVLDGALALALPTRPGQWLRVENLQSKTGKIFWKSLDEKGQTWWSGVFQKDDFQCMESADAATGERLSQILCAISALSPGFFKHDEDITIETRLEFPRDWGLGSSSTLLYTLAQWSGVDAFRLLEDTFGGSGYDLACAGASGPILYQKIAGQPRWETCDFVPDFHDRLYFVYLGKKQNSREGIARYRNLAAGKSALIEEISQITRAFLTCKNLPDFEKLIAEHENLVGRSLQLPRAKALYFADFAGEIKSLGAWGGDFVLATNPFDDEAGLKNYFSIKGFETVIKFADLLM